MFSPSMVMISAPTTRRLRMDSPITASVMDLYPSSGLNCDVPMVAPQPSRLSEDVEQLVRGGCVDGCSQEVVED